MPNTKKRRHPTRANLLLSWHRWCGLVALVFLLLAALSGSILVYKQALIKLIITPSADLPVNYTAQHMAPQLDRIAQRIKNDASGYLIKAPNAEEPYWTLTRDADRSVQLLAMDSLESYQNNLWLLQVLAFFRHLHTELFAGVIGEAVLLLSGLLGLLLSITGVVLWWPTKRSFRWRWIVPRRINVAYLMHYHRHAGTLAVPVLLIILLTGSIMLWQKLTGPILAPPPATQFPPPLSAADAATPAQLFLHAHQYFPDGWPTFIRLASSTNPTANFRYRLPDEWHPNGRTSVKIDLASGAITVSARSDNVDWQQNLINQNYPLHSGYGMNSLYRLLILCGGITLLWLGITGGLSYLRRNT
jgi:uncharacterized iron-regulated membrane protein